MAGVGEFAPFPILKNLAACIWITTIIRKVVMIVECGGIVLITGNWHNSANTFATATIVVDHIVEDHITIL